MGGAGTNTEGMIFGGNNPSGVPGTELWDGTSWTETANMANGRDGMGSGGTVAAAIGASGSPKTTSTEEWNDPVYTIKTVTVS